MNVSSNLKITKSLVSNITRSYSISKSSVKNQNNFIYSSKRFVNQNSWASARLKEIGEKVEFAEPLPLVLVTEEVLFNPPPKILNLVEMCVSFNQYEVKEMTERLGARLQLPVHPSAPNFGAPLPIGTASSSSEADIEAAKPKEKEAYTIKIGAVDQKVKIKVIKEVRVITGLGLKEAKELVEKAPVVLKDGVKKDEAENIKKILLEAGATVELV